MSPRRHTVTFSLLAGAIAAALLTVGPRASAEPPVEVWFKGFKRQYLDGLFKSKPHLATFMGDHRFDDRLPDLSEAGLAAREKELAAQQAAVTHYLEGRVDGSPHYPVDDRIDAEIIADGVALELLYLRKIRDWAWDPRLHDSFPYYDPREIVAGRLSDIIHGDFAPEAERRKSVIGQLRALPAFLGQERRALLSGKPKLAPREYVEQGIKNNQGRIEFFRTEVKEFVAADPAGKTAHAAALAALESYQQFLEKELLAKAGGDWRLGVDLYGEKFPLALQTRITPADAVKRAEVVFTQARADLLATAQGLHDNLWPAEPRLAGKKLAGDEARKVIGRVRDALGKQHPRPDELVAAHARNLDKLRAFIEKHDLLTLPPTETLRVEPMPLFKRGSVAAEYLAPGVLEGRKDFRATYYVDPIDKTWPPEKVESYLRGQNDYGVELTAAHEAYPGHHTQFFYSRKELDPVRATLWNGAMVEGWACYATTLLTRLGYGGERNPGYRFDDLRGRMIIATNLILDVKLQSGQMTGEEAVRFMTEEGFQERAVAEKKLLRAKLDSTQLAQYFLGLAEIEELEQSERARLGSGFQQRAFDEALIGHGSIAVRHIRSLLSTAARR